MATNESNSPLEEGWADRDSFLNLAGLFEGSLVLAALLLAWIAGIDLWEQMAMDGPTCARSLIATAPLFGLFAVTYRWPIGSLQRIKDLLLDVMGPPLAACRWYDLPLLAALAGLGEELLFRGVLQVGLDGWLGRGAGWIAASVLFGLAHAVTPTYAVLAGLIGLYLGGLLYVWQPPNLLIPILVHSLYDYAAFVVLRADYRRRASAGV